MFYDTGIPLEKRQACLETLVAHETFFIARLDKKESRAEHGQALAAYFLNKADVLRQEKEIGMDNYLAKGFIKY
jgi:hypothetical protein